MQYDTKLDSWFIVNFMNKKKDHIESSILWGIVHQDKKKRFKKGSYVSTSIITKIINDEIVLTLNSVYKIQKNKGITVELPNTYLTHQLLKSGFSPLMITKLFNFQEIH